MKKMLLVGPAGCGKTHTVLDDFERSLRSSDPLEPDSLFIVPSAEHTERVISLLIQRGAAGFFHERVTTLSRLASGIFQVTDIPVASSLARAMIVRELFAENEWEYFGEVRDRPGFLDLVLQFISELKEARVDAGTFRNRMNELKKFEPAYSAKYEALAAVYEGYEAKLKERGFRDAQDGLALYLERNKKKTAPPVKFSALWLDGFFDFSNLQLEYLRILSSMTENMTITLTKEEGDGRFNSSSEPRLEAGRGQAFEIIEATQRSLEAIGFKTQKMKPGNFRTKKPSLLHLQNKLFTTNPTPGVGLVRAPDGITFLDAVGIEGEIELIAREIHKLYATGAYRYSDFAVLFRQIRYYGRVIASIFSRYGIPAEIHERDRLKFSPWIAASTALLSIFRGGWQRDDVFAFLRSGYVKRFGEIPKDEEWLADLETRAFREGILESRDAWLGPWQAEADEKKREVFNRQKEMLFTVFAELEDKFRAAKNIDDHIRIFKGSVYRVFGILEISDENTPAVRRDAASVRRFETLLDEIRANVLKGGGRAVSFEAFADQFLGLVELDVYSSHERDKNRVQVYDVSLARQKEYKVVFVAGLLEKVFPLQIRENALLSDWERQLLNSGLEHPLGECLPRQSLERYLFYLAVTRASERLFLSYPHVDLEGKESLSSFFLEEVSGLFTEKIPVISQNLARPYPSLKEAITRREREAAVMGELRQSLEKDTHSTPGVGKHATPGVSRENLENVLRDPRSREKILAALTPVEAKIDDQKIRDGKYFELREASPTRLEEYAKCPYRHFAHRILKLQDPVEDVTARQKGNILHWVLEEFFRQYIKTAGKEVPLETFTEQKLKEAFEKYPLVSERDYREELDRSDVKNMLLSVLEKEVERLETSELKPAWLEYSFGSDPESNAPAFKIKTEKKELGIRGRVDRIDTDKEKKLGLVIDYKRTAKFDRSALELGTALQLPLYILAVEKSLGLKPVGGELFSLKESKRSGFYNKDEAEKIEGGFNKNSLLPEADFRKVLERTVGFVKRFAAEIENLVILVRPRDCEDFCPYPSVCRIEKWRLPLILQEIKEEDRAKAQALTDQRSLAEHKGTDFYGNTD